MFGFHFKKKKKIVESKVESFNQILQDQTLSNSLPKNIDAFKKLFENNDTVIYRNIQNSKNEKLQFCLVYSDGVVSSSIMNDNVIKPLILSEIPYPNNNVIDILMNQVVLINEVKKSDKLKDIIESLTYGDTIVFVEGSKDALLLNTKGIQTRNIMEPENERVLVGPREGFTENLLLNLSMVRRKVRTNELKMKFHTFGKQTQTKACICYIDSIVNKEILKELYNRLNKINIDGMLDTNYITELIKDSGWSPFRTIGYTEKPDVIVGKLLEGRIAVFVDGSPMVMTLPYLLIENFQSGEDYYLNYYYTTFSRLLRILGFFLTICVPSFYIAIIAYHREMLPTDLLVNIAIDRRAVPLPASVEAFVMLITFDILRETGVRMPIGIGQALSIVGAIVVGQAAVEAKLVTAPMIIVVALTGITNLLVPKLNASVVVYRMVLLVLSSSFGLFGFILGLSTMLIHILNLRSFGIPVLKSSNHFDLQDNKDIFFRAPWNKMRTRPKIMTNNKVRMNMPDGDTYD